MSDPVSKAIMKVAAAMSGLDSPSDRRALVDAFLRLYGHEASKPEETAAEALSRKRSEAGKLGGKASVASKQTSSKQPSKQEATVSVASHLPALGDKGGNSSLSSSSDLSVSLSESSPSQPLSEGGPKTSVAHDAAARLSLPGGGSEEPGTLTRAGSALVGAAGAPVSGSARAGESSGHESDSAAHRSTVPRSSEASTLQTRRDAEHSARGSRGAQTQAPERPGDSLERQAPIPPDCLSQPSTIPPPPPRTHNPAALVDAFTSGVNEAGGVWVCQRGKPWSDLAAALQPWVAQPLAGGILPACSALGRRYFAFCGGVPGSGWKAAEWLSSGAPEKPRPLRQDAASEAEERAAMARRAEEAKSLERDEERRRAAERRAPPPVDLLENLFKPPSATRLKSAEEQATELDELEKAMGGTR